MKIKFFAEITRPLNCLMAAIAVFIGASVAIKSPALNLQVFFAMIAAFLICAGGQVINDFFDAEIDKKIRPQKILPSQKISKKQALIFSAILFFGGLIFSMMINETTFLTASVFTLLLILYSAMIQKQKSIGNIVVALSTAFTLIFGAAVFQKFDTVIFLAASAFFANLSREIIKDVQDKKADLGYKKTIPMILSETQVNGIVFIFYLTAILLAVFVWTEKLIESTAYIILTLISAMIFMHSFALLWSKKAAQAQKQSKNAMIVSLIAFLAGAFK